ncbi:uncharacterized protein LOC123011147 [Tribolium madens]|uniref:uncharacterized protein LOC123011147 n=1 Tax=Tribolium madens TaxID=41895 RepID=UPI001CF74CFB|nr:uncharacterized protein LOC123011147 [Tribolium madens]
MSFLEDHNYGSLPQIKREIDKSPSPVPELNIKFECESHSDDSRTSPPLTSEPDFVETHFKQEVDEAENNENEELQKACIVQTCMKLLDSSSSDDDELLLYWMLCKNKKKPLRKRRK